MALTSATSLLVGSQAWFIQEGTAYTIPAAGTVAAESKPDASDPAWVRLYAVQNFEVTPPNGDEIEIFEPSPGRLRRTRVIRAKKKMDATLTLARRDGLRGVVAAQLAGGQRLLKAERLRGAERHGRARWQRHKRYLAQTERLGVAC
jgi:hypothetical protein